jgi:hypothetical protein
MTSVRPLPMVTQGVTLLATMSSGLLANSGLIEWNSAACCAMEYPHCSLMSRMYSTAARRCASAVMLCACQMVGSWETSIMAEQRQSRRVLRDLSMTRTSTLTCALSPLPVRVEQP